MPRGKKKKVAKKKAVKKKATTNKVSKKEEPKRKKQPKLIIDFEKPVASQFVDYLQDVEPDNIYGMFGTPENSLGVSKGIYSGLPTLDEIIAVKRDTNTTVLPLNRMIEIYGPESSGKTSLCKYLACKTIASGGIAIYVDFEHKYDPAWLRIIGKHMGLTEEDFKRLLYIDPSYFEWFVIWLVRLMKKIADVKAVARQELISLNAKKNKPENYQEMIDNFQKTIDMPFLVVVDSVAGIYTKSELEGEEEEDKHMAELARSFSEKLKIIRKHLGKSNTLILWVNQQRDVINIGGSSKRFGSMIKTTGGNALKYFLDGRLNIKRIGNLKRTRNDIERVYGTEHSIRMVKNQMGIPPFREAKLRLLYDRGYDSFASILEACAVAGVVVKKEGASRYVIQTGNNKLVVISTEIDEIQEKYPKLPEILLKQYQKKMEGMR